MRRTIKWTCLGLSSMLLCVCALALHTWYAKPLRLDWFYSRVFVSFALDSPELLSSLRILPAQLDFYGARLDDLSPAKERRMRRELKDALATLLRFDRSGLDAEGRISYDTLAYYLQVRVDGDAYHDYDFPVNQGVTGLQSALPDFMVQVHQVTTRREAEDYIARLEKFPEKFSQLIDSLDLRERKGIIPPRFTVDKVIGQMQAFVAGPAGASILSRSFREKLDKIPAGVLGSDERAALLSRADTAIAQRVYPAYGRLIAHFVALRPRARLDEGAWHLPDGDAYYAWCVRMHTTTDMTPQQVHDLGLADVARIGAEMEVVLKGLGLADGTLGARVQQLASNPAYRFADTDSGRQAMLARYQRILDDADKRIGGAFGIRPKLGMVVKAVPQFKQATAPPAYYDAGSFDNTRPGVFYANMRMPSNMPMFSMPTIAYHEGIPGHHFQVTIAQELKEVPFFRRVIPFTAYMEGWGLYAEVLADELGLEKTPLEHLGRLSSEMWRAARLVVDSGIHYKHWTRQQAIDYIVDHTGMSVRDTSEEVERYFVWPGQALAYDAGKLKILALREAAKKELGAGFDLKQFHDQVLGHGALPLTVLERVVHDWVARQGAAADRASAAAGCMPMAPGNRCLEGQAAEVL